MHPYPHTYDVTAAGETTGAVAVTSAALPSLQTAPPPEFDGPGGVWSPETLLCAAVADCFVLTFRAVSRVTQFKWLSLECRVEGALDRVERVPQFTRFSTFATLVVPPGTDTDTAHRVLGQAERGCLITNSLRGTRTFKAQVVEAAS